MFNKLTELYAGQVKAGLRSFNVVPDKLKADVSAYLVEKGYTKHLNTNEAEEATTDG